MRTLLVIAEHSGLAAAVRAVLDPDRYRIVAAATWQEAGPYQSPGMVDAVLLDADLTQIRPVRLIEQIRKHLPNSPLLVFAAARQWEWEEEAWLLGIAHLLTKPVRGRLLNLLLDRLWTSAVPLQTPPIISPHVEVRSVPPAPTSLQTLEVLRQFSAVLAHSLRTEPLLKQFLLLLREAVGVNRAAIFLRRPPAVFEADLSNLEDRRLHAVCGLGLPSGLLQHFELSLEAGIGWFVHRYGRVLRCNSEDAQANRETLQEFELLGAQVAIPILDREALLGVAVFDGPVTGEPFTNEELTLVFHLLEELGLAIRNSWLHDQLAANHQLMLDLLDQLGSACVLVGQKLEVLHANQAAIALFGQRRQDQTTLEFSDLPQALGAMAYAGLQPGTERQTSKYRPPDQPDRVYRVVVTPFRPQGAAAPSTALLLVEDFTQEERRQQLEVEAANLRLVGSMSEHLAHEIGNSLVPLLAHQQMLPDRYAEPEFRASLATALAAGVQRIARLSTQMQYLAGERAASSELVPIRALVEDALEEARRHFGGSTAELKITGEAEGCQLRGNRVALKHALAEIVLNALQAAPESPSAEVRLCASTDAQHAPCLHLEIIDVGPGFTAESVRRATAPFFSTKTVGLGLGLTVARKIIESHRGTLEIVSAAGQRPGCVRVRLPLSLSGVGGGGAGS